MDLKETLDFIDRQEALEERIISLVEQNAARLGNAFVKDLLMGIGQDSRKHAQLLRALRAAVSGSPQLISDSQRDSIARGINEHIKAESQAIATYSELVKQSNDNRVKTIAAMIREDEVRHHQLLLDLHKAVIEPETLTDAALWESLWKDSVTHGTPGG